MTPWERFRSCFVDGNQPPSKAYFLYQRSTEHKRAELLEEAEREQHPADQPIMEFLTERIGQQPALGLVSDERTHQEIERTQRILAERKTAIDKGVYVPPPSMADQLKKRLESVK